MAIDGTASAAWTTSSGEAKCDDGRSCAPGRLRFLNIAAHPIRIDNCGGPLPNLSMTAEASSDEGNRAELAALRAELTLARAMVEGYEDLVLFAGHEYEPRYMHSGYSWICWAGWRGSFMTRG